VALFCDVALPVPLDRVWTYRCPQPDLQSDGQPVVGGRVLVPFRNEKMSGIVTRLHDVAPPVEAKPLLAIVDTEPVLAPELLQLAEWIAGYYLCPLGEVLRTMLPLMAEVRTRVLLRIAEPGRTVLYAGAEQGSSRRSRKTPAEQDIEYSVLNYLENGEPARLASLRTATGASRVLLDGMVRKKWLVRETEAESRNADRTVRWAVLASGLAEPGLGHEARADTLASGPRLPKLNLNQQRILAELAGAGGALPLPELRLLLTRSQAEAEAPQASISTLQTLVRRGLLSLEDRPLSFHLSGVGGSTGAHTHRLNEPQTEALAAISASMEKGGFAPKLLYGVTGSGKTAVYLQAMQRALATRRGALLLVPEIGLTPAMAGQMHAAFGAEVALLHSQLTPEERAEQWHRIRRGEARIVVGTRSAVFAPVQNLGLLIVDEEHDGSYKQEEMPRYHARDVAVMRAKLFAATVVLGSATPSLESWQNAQKGRYALLTMGERVNNRPLPGVELLDMREEFRQTGSEQIFARKLIEETQATLDRGEQAIILLNRRGYSYISICRACGEKLQCENCAIALTLHKTALGAGDDEKAHAGDRLECHYCGYKTRVPSRCPHCESEHLYYLGAGSQQGEERLVELFPNARIGRMDRDTVRGRFDMERLLGRLHSGEINLLVGTQMIAKGHDIHGVTLVGVVGCDHALGLPDFRAAERVFQLLTQVSGRAGRGNLPGKVIVQTWHAEHYAIDCASRHDYAAFVDREMKLRRYMHYPPFAVLVNIVVHSPRLEEAADWAGRLGVFFRDTTLPGIRMLGPASAPLSKVKRIYRFHLVVKGENRAVLHAALRSMLQYAEVAAIPKRNLTIDVDAISLM
jgi:primosomal protein N' (replication factor Y)